MKLPPTTKRLNVTPAEYLKDPCQVPSFTYSIAKEMQKSARCAYFAHPRLGGKPKPPTPATDLGNLGHYLLLGKGADIVTVDADDWRTKAAQQRRIDIREAGKIPVLMKDMEEAADIAYRALDRLEREYKIRLNGESEVAFQWTETSSAERPVICRGMADHVTDAMIYDIKTTQSAEPEKCINSMMTYHYDIQWAAYTSALQLPMQFIFVEMNTPWDITIIDPDRLMQELGRTKWQKALDRWSECLATGNWPGYSTEVIHATPPMYALRKYEISVYDTPEILGDFADWEETNEYF